MLGNDFDSWLARQPIEVVVGECEQCGTNIYQSEEHYRTIEGRVCLECFEDFAVHILEAEVVCGIEGVLDY